MSKKAIVTLIVGDVFKKRWTQLCNENWKGYARHHNYDLILLDQPLDTSSRAKSRSPSWQKCLIFNLPQIKQYDQIAWVDSDVLFNPVDSLPICAAVPENKVGAVDSFADPSQEENRIALQRLWKISRPTPDKAAIGEYNNPEDVYKSYGSPVKPLKQMLNAGIFVASPKYHSSVFQHVYDAYEDRGNPSYYENVPLSYELVKRDLVHWLDPKFNHLYAWSKLLHYSFMYDWSPRTYKDKILRRLANVLGNDYEHRVAVACATSALLNSYCLHFAGCAKEMELVDLTAANAGYVANIGAR